MFEKFGFFAAGCYGAGFCYARTVHSTSSGVTRSRLHVKDRRPKLNHLAELSMFSQALNSAHINALIAQVYRHCQTPYWCSNLRAHAGILLLNTYTNRPRGKSSIPYVSSLLFMYKCMCCLPQSKAKVAENVKPSTTSR